MKTSLILFAALLLSGTAVQAQKFLPTFTRFSGSKPSYLILNSGQRVDFTVSKLKRKKGIIVWVKGRTINGKDKFKYRARELRELAMSPALLNKIQTVNDATASAVTTTKTDLNEYGANLVHFYPERLPRGNRTVLLELINPGFDEKIRVYDDPRAKETSGVGIGGLQLSGGVDKTYYVRHDGKMTMLRKRNYDTFYAEHFGKCPSLQAKYGRQGAWRDFADHIYFQTKNCQ